MSIAVSSSGSLGCDRMPRPLSFTGRRWVEPEDDAGAVALATNLGVAPLVGRCLARRVPSGIVGRSWMTPELADLHDPFLMMNMDVAVERVRRAVDRGERVRIVTDYDVDGTTSSLILQETFRIQGARSGGTGARVDYHIPHRFHEGYGFSVDAARRAVEEGVQLIVTADIGVRDHAAVTAARAGGVDVIIVDHHLPPGTSVPADATAVLCPPQVGCSYPNRHLAACGVSLKLAQALLADHPHRDRILRSMLKVAAIGTVADVVDLASLENRAIVSLGLEALNRDRHSPGLMALLEVSDLHAGTIDASDLGFRLGPRINAAGRIDDARRVLELFAQRDIVGARAIARDLDRMNHERRRIQDALVESVLGQVEASAGDASFIVVWGAEAEGWHRGVVGIVAARVRETLHRPVAVVSVAGDEARGSVRSIPALHAVDALDSAADLLVRYGGHPMAAGFTVRTADLEALRERLDAWTRQAVSVDDLVPTLELDGACDEADLERGLVESLQGLAPHGKGNPEPVLGIATQPRGIEVFSDRHLRFRMGGLEAVWWQGAEHRTRLEAAGAAGRVEIAGTPGIHHWRGSRSLRVTVVDARGP
jgi:single-stranded-DNA-specific exonuclease